MFPQRVAHGCPAFFALVKVTTLLRAEREWSGWTVEPLTKHSAKLTAIS